MKQSISLFFVTLLLASVSCAAEQQQEALKGTLTQSPDPTITASLKSIFSTLNGVTNTASLNPHTVCCDESCPLGNCNDFFTPAPTGRPDVTRTITAPPSVVTSTCCDATCSDGFCTPHRSPRPGRVTAVCPSRDPGCVGNSNGRIIPAFATFFPSGCVGRYCGAPTATKLGEVISIYPTSSETVPHDAGPTGSASPGSEFGDDPAAVFHAVELAGDDQDTIPIIVTNSSGAPVTLLADISLSLIENYISSGMLAALGISSTSSPQVVAIAKPDQRVAALGAEAFTVTPYAKASLDLLTGSHDAFKPFSDVKFNVFDLPSPKGGSMLWQPELFIGINFLRDAAALRLAEEFAGNPAVEGVPVLVRSMKGYQFSKSEGKQADGQEEHWEKDEL